MKEIESEMTIEREGEEVEVEIVGYFSPACRGSRERGTGLQMEPDEPEGIDDITASLDGVEIVLTSDEEEKACEILLALVEDDCDEPEPEDREPPCWEDVWG